MTSEYSRQDFNQDLTDLLNRGMVEGVVNPSQGTNFALVQYESYEASLASEADRARGAPIVKLGLPNPLDAEFAAIVDPEEMRRREEEFIRRNGGDNG